MDIQELFQIKKIQTNIGAKDWHKDSGVAAIYPPLTESDLAFIQSELNQQIPDLFKTFLSQTNGLFLKKLTLFGLPVKDSVMLDRKSLRPQSLISANQSWRLKYKVDSQHLMIGSKSGWTENTGIFLKQDGSIFGKNNQGIVDINDFENIFDWAQDA